MNIKQCVQAALITTTVLMSSAWCAELSPSAHSNKGLIPTPCAEQPQSSEGEFKVDPNLKIEPLSGYMAKLAAKEDAKAKAQATSEKQNIHTDTPRNQSDVELQKAQHINALRRDLDAAVDDLKARWFPKRTKVENYDIIAKTMRGLFAAGVKNIVEEMNSWGVTDFDKKEIFVVNAKINNNSSDLEDKIDRITRQNEQISYDLEATKRAAKETAEEISRLHR